jgi:DNA-binding transcriptional ArsR family regulator
MILGLAPTSGRALVFDHPCAELSRAALRIGAMLEATDFHPGRSGPVHREHPVRGWPVGIVVPVAVRRGQTLTWRPGGITLYLVVKRDLGAAATAIASVPRREIIERLALGPASMTDLAEALSVTLSAVDKHLRVLLDGGLVTKVKRGRTTVVRLEPGSLQELAVWAMSTGLMWSHLLDRFEAHLSESGSQER